MFFVASASPRQAQYFVYCKTCKDITPGKLRVCCSRCNEGAMVLYQVTIIVIIIVKYILIQRNPVNTDIKET